MLEVLRRYRVAVLAAITVCWYAPMVCAQNEVKLLSLPPPPPQPSLPAAGPVTSRESPTNLTFNGQIRPATFHAQDAGQAMEAISLPPAQPSALSLDDLESMALANNPTLAQAAANVRAMRGKWVQDGLYPNPRLSYKGDEMGDENTAGFQGFQVTQEIVTRGKLGLAQNVDSQEIVRAQQQYAAQEFRVRNDVKLRFYEVLLAQRALELSQELERIARIAAKAADDLFKASEVGRGDVLQAQIESETMQLQAVKARNAEDAAWRRLVVVVGLP